MIDAIKEKSKDLVLDVLGRILRSEFKEDEVRAIRTEEKVNGSPGASGVLLISMVLVREKTRPFSLSSLTFVIG